MLLRLPSEGNRELTAISATETGYKKLHFEFESRSNDKLQLSIKDIYSQHHMGINWFAIRRDQTAYVPFLSNRRNNDYYEPMRSDQIENIFFDFNNLPNLTDHLTNDELAEKEYFDNFCNNILNFPIRAIATPNGKMPGKTIDISSKILLPEMGDGVANIIAMGAWLSLARKSIFVIDQIESDLHPSAIKSICDFIVSSVINSENQFFIATHSHIVLTTLGSYENSQVFHVDSRDERKSLTTSTVRKIKNSSEERISILRDLGYALSDLELFEGWLILEESSAQTLIKFIISYGFPKLRRIRIVSANGRDKVEPAFDNFNRIFLFQHLETVYQNRAWILIDGDEVGKKIVSKMKGKYTAWPEGHFRHLNAPAIEYYYPDNFAELGIVILETQDDKKRALGKKKLIMDLEAWLYEDPNRGIAALRESASEIFDILGEIQTALYPQPST